jgi:hypothetical protein
MGDCLDLSTETNIFFKVFSPARRNPVVPSGNRLGRLIAALPA